MSMFTKKAKAWHEYLNYMQETNVNLDDQSIKEKLSFLSIDKDTLNNVKEAANFLEPYKEEIVNQFYGNIIAVDHLEQIINDHSTVERLRMTMVLYLEQFLQADIDEAYIQTRMIIGEVHSRIHLTADHFISAHHLLIQMMTSIVMEKLHNKPNKMMKYVIALQKLAAFDQQLIVEVYMEKTIKNFLFGISDMLNHTTQLDTTRQLITSMDEQIAETHNVTAATEEMSASIQEVANHAVKVAEKTDEAVQSATESKEVVDKALTDIQEVGSVYEDVVEKVTRLETEIKHTQNVINIIKDIAEQTNLLALNASIEAARAGEHGKGFAVVASEVRKLSEHTKEQITQITNNMTALLNVSDQVTDQINQTGNLVEQSVTGANHAGEALSGIVMTMKEINEATSQIAAMSEEQTSAVIDIAERNAIIYDHSVDSQHIAKQTAENILDLSKEMEKYRNQFFSINIQLQPKDIIRAAKTDHLLWKWKVYNMILGIEMIDLHQVTSHEQCRLGKWYYGELNSNIKNSKAFKEIEAPHKAVHDFAKLAVKHYDNGDFNAAQETFEQLQEASNTVIGRLSELENIVK